MHDVRHAGGYGFKPRGIQQQAIQHGGGKALLFSFFNVFGVGRQNGFGVLANSLCQRGQGVVSLLAARTAQNPRGCLGVFA